MDYNSDRQDLTDYDSARRPDRLIKYNSTRQNIHYNGGDRQTDKF